MFNRNNYIILIGLIILLISGCSIKYNNDGAEMRLGTDNLIYGSGTCIGVSVAISEAGHPAKATLGYDNYTFISKPQKDKSTINTGVDGEVGWDGRVISGSQHINIGK